MTWACVATTRIRVVIVVWVITWTRVSWFPIRMKRICSPFLEEIEHRVRLLSVREGVCLCASEHGCQSERWKRMGEEATLAREKTGDRRAFYGEAKQAFLRIILSG